jgi:hypothetical protein
MMLKRDLPNLFAIPKWYKNLFFVKRRPKFRFERDWPTEELKALDIEKPKNDQEKQAKAEAQRKYNGRLAQEGFISDDLFTDPGLITPELQADLRELEQYLLPRFWALDQEARYYQNLHYLYQWIFIIGAFMTTLLAAFSVWLYGADVTTNTVTNILGLITTVIGATTGSISFLETRQSPQKRWFQSRSKAERLRSLYFLFLARQNPLNINDAKARIKELRRLVLATLRERSDTDEHN